MEEITTKQIMEYLIGMNNRLDQQIDRLDRKFDGKFVHLEQKFEAKFQALDQKFEEKFNILCDAIGELSEKFTIIDYKYIQLKRHILAM